MIRILEEWLVPFLALLAALVFLLSMVRSDEDFHDGYWFVNPGEPQSPNNRVFVATIGPGIRDRQNWPRNMYFEFPRDPRFPILCIRYYLPQGYDGEVTFQEFTSLNTTRIDDRTSTVSSNYKPLDDDLVLRDWNHFDDVRIRATKQTQIAIYVIDQDNTQLCGFRGYRLPSPVKAPEFIRPHEFFQPG